MTTTTETTKILLTLDTASTARCLLHAIDWPTAYYLGSVAVHDVEPTHWLARHAHLFDLAEVVTVEQRDEAELWRRIAAHDRLMGAPPSRAIVVSRDG